MDTATQILVIIVSAVLVLFLLAAIAAIVLFMRVLKSVRHVIQTAEKIADSAESVTDFFRDASGPLALFKVVRNMAKVVQHKQKRG